VPGTAGGPNTITNLSDLLDNVHRIQREGYSVSNEDVSAGVAAVGAPVRNHLGQVVASISVSGIASTYTPERIADLADAVRSASYRFSLQVGYGAKDRQPTERRRAETTVRRHRSFDTLR
jgi:DNA-binding IclR family transcriptional regulator